MKGAGAEFHCQSKGGSLLLSFFFSFSFNKVPSKKEQIPPKKVVNLMNICLMFYEASSLSHFFVFQKNHSKISNETPFFILFFRFYCLFRFVMTSGRAL